MTSTVSASAEARLESLLKPYRDLSNAHMESIWTEFAAEHPEGSFPSTKETLLELSSLATGEAVGGSKYPNTNFDSCPWPTLSCKAGQC